MASVAASLTLADFDYELPPGLIETVRGAGYVLRTESGGAAV